MLAMIVVVALALAIGVGLFFELSPDVSVLDANNRSEADRHFTLHVWPLLEAKCVACHGDDSAEIKGELELTSREGFLRGGESGEPSIIPGKPNKSLLMEAIHRNDLEMPPKEKDRLTKDQIAVIEKWIADAAPWPSQEKQRAIKQAAWEVADNEEGMLFKTSGGLSDDWTYRRYQAENLWAYQPIRKVRIDIQDRNPIDVLIERRLAASGLAPAPNADPLTLIRRVTFDVIGLPPSPEEIQEFLVAWHEEAELAWASLVDRLLASPHYGEQAARHWLDVVRYADSSGFANDWERPNAWRYRDYVIRAFNEDKPYDQFVREQLAGDEINAHDPAMKVAVGFLRMGPWEHSAMSVPKVSRQQYLDDVTSTVGQTFLAHPLQCARCHDHKFDPVPMRDYYSIQAVFATTQLADVDAAWLPEENIAGMEEDRQSHERKRAWNEATLAKLKQKIANEEKAWFRERDLPYESRAQAKSAAARPEQIPEHRVGLTPDDLGRERISRKWRLRFDWEQIRYEPIALSVYNGSTNLPKGVNKRMQVPADPLQEGVLAQTTVLTAGDPFSPGEAVEPGVLSAANRGKSFKITQQPSGRRLALADWLVDPANPLTARVMVNRIWQADFGRGLVGTPNNFGAMGKKPTHPELLDFLAATFVEQGWSVKQLHRLILTSEAYRRASQHPAPVALEEHDPERKLYAVHRPRRLVAEELRDAMLSVTGELNPTSGGIPARPDINLEAALQPRLIMGTFAPAYVPHAKPSQRNRRTIYALKLRGLRDPFLEVFNQPSSDIACELRDQSNVTPQVFSLMNSQESADRALALAKRILDTTESDDTAVEQLFWLVFGRAPTADEAVAVIQHWQDMQTRQAKMDFQPSKYPTRILRRANEELSGQVFEFVERLFGYEDYIPDLQPHEVDARTRGLADVCLMMLNSNEFAYIY